MGLKLNLSMGALGVAALLSAGLSYRSLKRELATGSFGRSPPLSETPTTSAPAPAPATSQPSQVTPPPKTIAPAAPAAATNQPSQAAAPPPKTTVAAPATSQQSHNATSLPTTTAPARAGNNPA